MDTWLHVPGPPHLSGTPGAQRAAAANRGAHTTTRTKRSAALTTGAAPAHLLAGARRCWGGATCAERAGEVGLQPLAAQRRRPRAGGSSQGAARLGAERGLPFWRKCAAHVQWARAPTACARAARGQHPPAVIQAGSVAARPRPAGWGHICADPRHAAAPGAWVRSGTGGAAQACAARTHERGPQAPVSRELESQHTQS